MISPLVTRERIEKALDAHDAAQACLNVMLDLWEDLRPGGPLLLVRQEDAEQALRYASSAGQCGMAAEARIKQSKLQMDEDFGIYYGEIAKAEASSAVHCANQARQLLGLDPVDQRKDPS